MKIKVNLAGRRKYITSNKLLVVRVFWAVFGLLFLSFFSYTGYAWFKVYNLKTKIDALNTQTVLLSNEIRTNNELVNEFVLAKGILDKIEKVNSGKFSYKRYMDEIVAMLPSNVILRNVDFQSKGFVAVSAFVPDLATLKVVEERIGDTTIIDQTVFGSVFSEGLTRDRSGGYVIKFQFELKKNV